LPAMQAGGSPGRISEQEEACSSFLLHILFNEMNATNLLYELNNYQRQYFGLNPVEESWVRQQLNDTVIVYFNNNTIVKVLNYIWGYMEYDTDIRTRGRAVLLPKTTRGKEQSLTVPRILKIKGSGIQFSGSFQGGGIHVYDNKRNSFFIQSFVEEGEIKSYQDIDNWISNYIANTSADYPTWLNNQLSQNRLKIKYKEGDIIAFKISHNEYGFARILLDAFSEIKRGFFAKELSLKFHPRSVIVAPYAYYSKTIQIDIDLLLMQKTLPALCMFDTEIHRGTMPIIGYRPLSERDKAIPFPSQATTFITILYTKEVLEKFIDQNGNGT